MTTTFPFVLLRATSGAPRHESINVGLVAWPFGKPVVRLAASAARLRALHPNLARIDFQGWSDKVVDALAVAPDVPGQIQLLSILAHPFRADEEPGIASAEDGQEELAIDELIERLVAPPASTIKGSTRKRANRMVTEIRDWLRRGKLYSSRVEDLSRGRVVSQFPVDPASDLYVDFALKNGAVHVIETLDLRDVDRLSPAQRGEAALKGVTLDEAKDKFANGTRIALVQASDYGVARPAINLIGRYADETWNIGDSGDRARFVKFISGSLHANQLPGF